MLDSSPIRGPTIVAGATQVPPPPPQKLKRSASVASLPSPPPSVQPPRKRTNRLRLKSRSKPHAGDSDTEDGEMDGEDVILEDDEEDGERSNMVGRKILFPTASSLLSVNGSEVLEPTEDDPFVVQTSSPSQAQKTISFGLRSPVRRSLSPVRRSPRLQAAASLTSAPSTPVKSKPRRSLSLSPVRPSTRASVKKDKENKGKCRADELPVVDETEDNPFLVKALSPRNKRLVKSKVANKKGATEHLQVDEKDKTKNDATSGRDEKPTITYVFKGVKTHLPNPYYNLSPSVYEKAKLPLDHPDFEPLPSGPSQLKLKPKKRKKDQVANGMARHVEDKGEGSSKREDFDEDVSGEDDLESEIDANADGDKEDSSPAPEPRTPENKPRVKYSGFKSESGKPLLDSGPEGVRGAVMDADEIGRMAVGPVRDRTRSWQQVGRSAEIDI